MKFRLVSAIALCLLVFAAGCTNPSASVDVPDVPPSTTTGGGDITQQSVSGSAGAVGGSVTNSAPTITSFVPSATTGDNRGAFTVVFTGTVKDKNTEAQIRNISVVGLGLATLGGDHVVTVDERAATAEPDFGADGFKVWTDTPRDGILNFKYRQTFPTLSAAGTYVFTAHAFDAPGFSGASAPIPIVLTPFSEITISAAPVGTDGVSIPGANWGEWAAEAGAVNVAASNYIKLVNTGDTAEARVVIDFAEAFVGSEDPSFSVPVANNLAFSWWEDTTPEASAPSEGTFNFLPVDPDGTTTVEFSARNSVIYVTYRIAALPEILPVQPYGVSFTVTEL